MMGRFDWPIRWFSVLLAGLLFTITLNTDVLASAAYLIINQGLFITMTCYLLLPTPGSAGSLFANCIAGVPLLIILSQLPVAGIIPLAFLFQISVIILCLSFFLWSLSQLLTVVLADDRFIRKLILLFTVFIISTPIWLGPLVDIYQPGDSTTNGIIAITPLTHFSVAAGYDYLRSEWFYQNTPFGSLPFSYPSLIHITAGYLLLVIFMQSLRWWLTHLIQTQKHSLNIS
ncbi:MAG: hypothetical protein QNL05_00350 [Gammaproteobacteria bacterium]|nr:hypothetical protein [Gammaproteobacteria bacterium]